MYSDWSLVTGRSQMSSAPR